MAADYKPFTGPRVSIVDKTLGAGKGEVSASAFAFLFGAMVQYRCVAFSHVIPSLLAVRSDRVGAATASSAR